MSKEELKQMRAYESFIDAINYRRGVLAEYLNEKHLPKNIRTEILEKMDKIDEISNAFF